MIEEYTEYKKEYSDVFKIFYNEYNGMYDIKSNEKLLYCDMDFNRIKYEYVRIIKNHFKKAESKYIEI